LSARTGDKTAREVRIELIRHLAKLGYTAERMAPQLGMRPDQVESLANKAYILVKSEGDKS